MIGRLRGILLEKQAPHLLIDVMGIAYEVFASMVTFSYLPEMGKEVMLHTHLVVREDAQQLYGFYNHQERELFRSLIKISGIGPKIALTILSSTDPEQFIRCVIDNNVAALTRLPGIGKKTAERLVVEMRDKFAHSFSNLPNYLPSAEQDAVNALITLGYKAQEASLAISKINQQGMASEDLIRFALKNKVKS